MEELLKEIDEKINEIMDIRKHYFYIDDGSGGISENLRQACICLHMAAGRISLKMKEEE